MVNCLPQRQQIILAASQSMSYVTTTVSDTYTTIISSPLTTLSVVECLTSAITTTSEQDIPTLATTAGV